MFIFIIQMKHALSPIINNKNDEQKESQLTFNKTQLNTKKFLQH
jgi:hypothetical protein